MATKLEIETAQMLRDGHIGQSFTAREFEVYCLIVAGNSNKEMASGLGISVKTIEKHRQKVYLKTGSHCVFDLFLYEQHTLLSHQTRETDGAADSTPNGSEGSDLTIPSNVSTTNGAKT